MTRFRSWFRKNTATEDLTDQANLLWLTCLSLSESITAFLEDFVQTDEWLINDASSVKLDEAKRTTYLLQLKRKHILERIEKRSKTASKNTLLHDIHFLGAAVRTTNTEVQEMALTLLHRLTKNPQRRVRQEAIQAIATLKAQSTT